MLEVIPIVLLDIFSYSAGIVVGGCVLFSLTTHVTNFILQVCHACLQPFLKAHQEASNPCLQRHENYEIKKPKVTIEQLEMDITAYKLFGPAGSEESEECSVCLMEYEPGEEVCRPRGCVHQFHAKCIKSWLEKNGQTCPLCRTTFIRKDQELVVVE